MDTWHRSTPGDPETREGAFPEESHQDILQASLASQLPEAGATVNPGRSHLVNSSSELKTGSLHKLLDTPRRNGSHQKEHIPKSSSKRRGAKSQRNTAAQSTREATAGYLQRGSRPRNGSGSAQSPSSRVGEGRGRSIKLPGWGQSASTKLVLRKRCLPGDYL